MPEARVVDRWSNSVEFQLIDIKDGVKISNGVIKTLSALNSQAFSFSEPTPQDETRDRLAVVDTILFAYQHSKAVGFATFQEITSGSQRVVYQSRGIIASHRKLGIGRYFTRFAIKYHKPDILVAHAQNPISIWATIQSRLLECIYPIDKLYSEDSAMQNTLINIITTRNIESYISLDTGLHQGAYRMGKLGDYEVDLTHPGIAMVEGKLQSLGLDRERGDAIYYMGKVNKI